MGTRRSTRLATAACQLGGGRSGNEQQQQAMKSGAHEPLIYHYLKEPLFKYILLF
jgi:hypothetical protein